jgi:hypothetical protein
VTSLIKIVAFIPGKGVDTSSNNTGSSLTVSRNFSYYYGVDLLPFQIRQLMGILELK